MKNYFFNKSFYSMFDWEKSVYFVGAILPDYKSDLAQGMGELSQDSIRNRFLGGKKTLTESELDYLTQFDGVNHFALGLRNEKNKGIAVARMVRSSEDPLFAEAAITIIDEYQNKGLGTLLFEFIAYAAYERGLDGLIIHLLAQNEGMQKISRKAGKITRKVINGETVTYAISFEDIEMNKLSKKIESFLIKIKRPD